MKTTTFLLALAPLALLGGCAADKELQRGSRTLGVYIDTARENAVQFAQGRDRIARARVATLNFLQAGTLDSEQAIQSELSAREITQDKEWLGLAEGLRKAPALIATQRRERDEFDAAAQAALQGARSGVDVKAARLLEASGALAGLAQDRSTEDELKFYRDFVKQVDAAIKQKAADAGALADKAADASKAKSSMH